MSRLKVGDRDWLSPREAARLLGLCHMTVIRRFDAGDIEGFRVPGSRFRRIPKRNLVEFARRHQIPLPEPSGEERDAAVTSSWVAGSRRALVVEDDRRMAEVLEKLLKRDGWEVRVARNGFDAGFLALSFLPELVLLDIMLPGLDGREACREMRSDPRLAETKILAVTALRNGKSVDDIFDAGVDGYLPKPFNLSELREKIKALVSREAGEEKLGGRVKARREDAEHNIRITGG